MGVVETEDFKGDVFVVGSGGSNFWRDCNGGKVVEDDGRYGGGDGGDVWGGGACFVRRCGNEDVD